ncbi:MAG: PQQ-binding-like beta-propeller repeat protein [Limisphaerales bacterium]
MSRWWAAGLGIGLMLGTGWADDWPLYRGPQGDGICRERINLDWPAEGPRKLWSVPLTNGLSSVTVSQGRVFTQVWRRVNDQNTEFCLALDADTGQILWTRPVGPADYRDGQVPSFDGPRSTPSVAGDRVYVLGSHLQLHCLEAATGRPVWSKDLVGEFGSTVISWQNAASPLILGDRIFLNLNAGPNRLAALRASDGSVIWRRHDHRLTHATPVPATIHGIDQIIFFTQTGLVAVAPNTGDELWLYPFGFSLATAASPVVDGNTVFCSAAYSRGAAVVSIEVAGTGLTPVQQWKSTIAMQLHWSTAVAKAGHVFGLTGQASHFDAPLRCVDLATGEQKWSEPGFGLGATLLVNDRILALTEGGDVVVVDPDPAGYRERAHFKAVPGRIWNSPAISNGRLYVRGTTELAAFDVSLPGQGPLKLLPPTIDDVGTLRLTIAGADDVPLEPSRAAGVEVLMADDTGSPLAQWARLEAGVTWVNGRLQLEAPTVGGGSRRFFILRENR